MTVKTDMSRFHIHDELTAPEGSIKILKGVQGAAGEVSKFIGVLAALARTSERPDNLLTQEPITPLAARG